MKKAGFNCKNLCKMQANLFLHYYKYSSCSPLVFARRFMTSKVAERFDTTEILLESSTEKNLVEEIDAQYCRTSHGKVEENLEAMYWIGYIYRYWCYVYEVKSKVLIQALPPSELYKRYYVYHSMDLDYAIERIAEEENICLAPKKTVEKILEELIQYESK